MFAATSACILSISKVVLACSLLAAALAISSSGEIEEPCVVRIAARACSPMAKRTSVLAFPESCCWMAAWAWRQYSLPLSRWAWTSGVMDFQPGGKLTKVAIWPDSGSIIHWANSSACWPNSG